MEPLQGERSRLKTIVFSVIMVLMVVLSIELLSQLTFYYIFKKRYCVSNLIKSVTQEYQVTRRHATFLQNEAIHPYLGYVVDFGDEKKNFNTKGFHTRNQPMVKKEEGKLNIVILGGSVAYGLAPLIESAWKNTFNVTPCVVNLALPGYKEPQQLMVLSYFLSLGAAYDIVINIDGFNEIFLSSVENYAAGINFSFPRSWKLRVTANPTHNELALIGKIKYLREMKERRLKEFSDSLFNLSAVYGLIKIFKLKDLNVMIYNNAMALLSLQRNLTKRFDASGPVEKYDDIKEVYQASTDLWCRCSLMMNTLAKDNGFEYYHFLQPNQYLHGSKKLTEEEKRIAYAEDSLYVEAVATGYPMLIEKGNILQKKNVKFFNATQLFSNVAETIYSDNCCHYNKKGNMMLAEYIIQQIAKTTKINHLKAPR